MENKKFTVDYLDPKKRSIGNAIQVFFKDGTKTKRIEVEYPIGHRRRRKEGIPVLLQKFAGALRGKIPARQADAILALCGDSKKLDATPVSDFMALWVV
jgi:2-methylcitrate dehydratase